MSLYISSPDTLAELFHIMQFVNVVSELFSFCMPPPYWALLAVNVQLVSVGVLVK